MHRVVRRQTDIRGHGSVGTVSTGVLTGSAFQLLGVVVGRGGGSVVTGTSSPEDCVAPMAGVYNVFRSNEYLLERRPSIFSTALFKKITFARHLTKFIQIENVVFLFS